MGDNNNNQWGDFAVQQANNLVGAGMGLALEGHNDRRQLRQQGKLQQMQMQGNMAITDYNMNKQYEMWLKTNYQEQMRQMKMAGLNPGLMYGMGGGGGTTTGQATGQVSGAEAPKGGGEVIAQQGLGIQSALLQAQKENIQASTEKTKAETANLPLAGKEIQSRTANLDKQWDLMAIDEDLKNSTLNAQKSIIISEMRTKFEEMEIAVKQNKMTEEQLRAQVDLMKAQAAKMAVDNGLTKAQTELAGKQGGKIDEEIEKIKKEVQMMDNYYDLENFIEREKVTLMNKGINVALISATLGSILNFGSNLMPKRK